MYYHTNELTGISGRCKAEVSCPFMAKEEHSLTLEEAQARYEYSMKHMLLPRHSKSPTIYIPAAVNMSTKPEAFRARWNDPTEIAIIRGNEAPFLIDEFSVTAYRIDEYTKLLNVRDEDGLPIMAATVDILHSTKQAVEESAFVGGIAPRHAAISDAQLVALHDSYGEYLEREPESLTNRGADYLYRAMHGLLSKSFSAPQPAPSKRSHPRLAEPSDPNASARAYHGNVTNEDFDWAVGWAERIVNS